jgi:hypothetical protein
VALVLSAVCALYIAFIVLNVPHLLRSVFFLSPNLRLAVAAKLQFSSDLPADNQVRTCPLENMAVATIGALLFTAYFVNRDTPGAALFLVDAFMHLGEVVVAVFFPKVLRMWWRISVKAPDVIVGLSILTRTCTIMATYLVYWRG